MPRYPLSGALLHQRSGISTLSTAIPVANCHKPQRTATRSYSDEPPKPSRSAQTLDALRKLNSGQGPRKLAFRTITGSKPAAESTPGVASATISAPSTRGPGPDIISFKSLPKARFGPPRGAPGRTSREAARLAPRGAPPRGAFTGITRTPSETRPTPLSQSRRNLDGFDSGGHPPRRPDRDGGSGGFRGRSLKFRGASRMGDSGRPRRDGFRGRRGRRGGRGERDDRGGRGGLRKSRRNPMLDLMMEFGVPQDKEMREEYLKGVQEKKEKEERKEQEFFDLQDQKEMGLMTAFNPSLSKEDLVGWMPSIATADADGSRESVMRSLVVLGGGEPYQRGGALDADAYGRRLLGSMPVFYPTEKAKWWMKNVKPFKQRVARAPNDTTKQAIVDSVVRGIYKHPKHASLKNPVGLAQMIQLKDGTYQMPDIAKFEGKLKSLLPEYRQAAAEASAAAGAAMAKARGGARAKV